MRIRRDVPVYYESLMPPRVAHAVLDNGDGTGTILEGFMFLDERPEE